MKKAAIIAIVALAVSSAFAQQNIVITNFTFPYVTVEDLATFVDVEGGAAFVQNRPEAPVAVFNGTDEGGVPIAAGNSPETIYLTKPYYTETNATTNRLIAGQQIITAIDTLNAQTIINGYSHMTLMMEPGYYASLTNSIVVSNELFIATPAATESLVPGFPYVGTQKALLVSTADPIMENASGASLILYGMSFIGSSVRNLESPDVIYADRCSFDGPVVFTATLASERSVFTECCFSAPVSNSVQTASQEMTFDGCRFEDGAQIHGSKINDVAIFRDCVIDSNTDPFVTYVSTGSAQSTLQVEMYGCTVANAATLFDNAKTTRFIARDCVFTGGDANWVVDAFSEFWNCKGVSTNAVTLGALIMNCTDENGNILENQP